MEDLREMTPQEVEQLAAKLKPLQARKFVKKVAALGGSGEQ